MTLIDILMPRPMPPVPAHMIRKCGPGMPPEQPQRRQFASAHNIRMAQALDEKFRAAMAGRGPMTVAEIAQAIGKTHRQAASSILRAEARGRVRRVGDRATGVTYEWVEGAAA